MLVGIGEIRNSNGIDMRICVIVVNDPVNTINTDETIYSVFTPGEMWSFMS